jgi:hypothetical protein
VEDAVTDDLLRRATQLLAVLRQGTSESPEQQSERSEKSEISRATSLRPPAALINDARAAGVELAINPASTKLEVTFGPATVQPLPATLILECVRRGHELRPLVEAAAQPGTTC